MKFIFDNNLPPTLAHALHAMCQAEDFPVQVIHLADRFNRNALDTDWIPALATEGGWTVVSQDAFKKSLAERELIRERGVSVYVLDPQWSSKPYWMKAQRLVEWWPLILQHTSLSSNFAVRVPWRVSGKRRFEQIRA